MDAVLTDYRTAPIDARERALFAFIAKVNSDESSRLQPQDLDEVKAAGWTVEALYDAITVCALFNFYNNWIDATGVSDMAAAGFEEGDVLRVAVIRALLLCEPLQPQQIGLGGDRELV